MSANPIQKKVRNSFLLGMLIAIVVVAIIGVLVFLLVIKPGIEKQEETVDAYVYKLKAGVNVEAGKEITSSMVESVKITTNSKTIDYIPAKKQNSDKELVSAAFPGGKAKIDLMPGTILTNSMLYEEEIADTLRYVEYNMITMPTTLDVGSYVDIRLRLANAQDLIVLSQKEVINIFGQTIGFNLTEEEILILNSAIVESYIITSSEIYLATYIEPGLQQVSQYTYSPTAEVVELIKANPNIVAEVRADIANRYNNSGAVRNPINNQLSQYLGEADYNIEAGIQEQIQEAREARESYLSGLEGY